MTSPQFYANQVLEKLRIGSFQDLRQIELVAWARGVLVQDKELTGAEARIAIRGRRAIITISSKITDSHRRRFDIAHELGHFEMHRTSESLALCTNDDLIAWSEKQSSIRLEREANEFAAALLLPQKLFEPLCSHYDPSIEGISVLSEQFDVSLTATALRYIDFSKEPCAVVFSQEGYVRWFRANKAFNELDLFVEVRSKPDPSTVVAGFFQGRSIPRTTRRVPAETWLAPGRFKRNATLIEQSLALSSYNAVLTLLRIDDEMEEDEFEKDDE